ncbi:MAG: helicase-related protein [Emcibacteraceae bacterium]|nr:helicase-related protein [Emcibacteraceae bacterium]
MKNISNQAAETKSHVKAVLGPTNTGKTHLAVERMLGHASGMIGLPLRLLAREIYDRVVDKQGNTHVALITGEEKIVPKNARYFICTVESMPVERTVDFLAIDEVQLAADFDRGHVFTDRLLRSRGRQETMLLGSETIRPLIKHLIPDVEFITRPRFSELIYVEPKKLSRLPRRSALITFSTNNVYAYAEMLRRAKGGVAVVMGALSPRTRNAQVELYQNGDVDHVVATDAIGMGLNMDIDHVSFADTSKFDGRTMRDLMPSELAQIAGRAGRYMNNGTFGCLTEGADYQSGLSPEMVYAVENHQFAPLTVLQWRNAYIDFSRAESVIRSLAVVPKRSGLTRTMDKLDLDTFRKLSETTDIKDMLGGPAAVKMLWEVCQIPDFRQVSDDEHAKLCASIYRQISADNGRIKEDWFAEQIKPFKRIQGDIDALSARIAYVRTLTYISNRSGWCENQKYWQSQTRDVEDRLSDALHERLTKRFVSRRTSVLMRELRQKGKLMANIETDGGVYVEDHFIGTIEGFQFKEDEGAFGEDSKILRNAADKTLKEEIKNRAEEFNQAEDGEISLIFGDPLTRSTINWRGIPVGRIMKGTSILTPKALVQPTPVLQGDALNLVQAKLERWLEAHIADVLAPLFALQEAANGAKDEEGNDRISGMARGIAFQMVEKLGTIPRRLIAKDFIEVDSAGRFQIKKLGVWLGATSLYIPALLKPAPAQLRLLLWALFNDQERLPEIPPAGLCTIKVDQKASRVFYEVTGYRVVGENAVRLDMLERLANAAREVSMKGPFPMDPDLMSLVGTSGTDFIEIMKYLGYVTKEYDVAEAAEILAKRKDDKQEKTNEDVNSKAKDKEEDKSSEKTEEVSNAEKSSEKLEDAQAKVDEVKPAEKVIIFTHKPENTRRRPQGKPNQGKKKPFKGKKKHAQKGPTVHKANAPAKKASIDPDSPFAALAGLKDQMKGKK